MTLPTPYQRSAVASKTYSNSCSDGLPTPANTPSNHVFPTPHTPHGVGTACRGLGGRSRRHALEGEVGERESDLFTGLHAVTPRNLDRRPTCCLAPLIAQAD